MLCNNSGVKKKKKKKKKKKFLDRDKDSYSMFCNIHHIIINNILTLPKREQLRE